MSDPISIEQKKLFDAGTENMPASLKTAAWEKLQAFLESEYDGTLKRGGLLHIGYNKKWGLTVTWSLETDGCPVCGGGGNRHDRVQYRIPLSKKRPKLWAFCRKDNKTRDVTEDFNWHQDRYGEKIGEKKNEEKKEKKQKISEEMKIHMKNFFGILSLARLSVRIKEKLKSKLRENEREFLLSMQKDIEPTLPEPLKDLRLFAESASVADTELYHKFKKWHGDFFFSQIPDLATFIEETKEISEMNYEYSPLLEFMARFDLNSLAFPATMEKAKAKRLAKLLEEE